MKSVIKYIIIFILVFLILLVGKLIYDKVTYEKSKPKEPVEYKLSNNLYFIDVEIELTLNTDGTYFMYEKDNVNSGNYKILDNTITFIQTKKHLNKCYNLSDNISTSYLAIFDDKNELTKIDIGDKELNITQNSELSNSKKILDNSNVDCSSLKKTYPNEKYSHDYVVENKKITYESDVSETDKNEINEFLYEFYDRYFEIISSLEYKDISDMFNNQENAYMYKTALELLVENRKNNENDLSILNPKYELTIKNFKKSGNDVSFSAIENCSYNFSFIKEYTSSVYNIENQFTLTKTNGKYKIKYYKKVQDFYVMITDVYSSTSNYKSKLDSIKQDYLIIS